MTHDFKKLLQQKDELAELWAYLEIKTQFPEKEVRRWLLEFSKDEVESAIGKLAKYEGDVVDAVKYAGKILHNSKLQNMTVEEREAKISALRSVAGTIGARRKHEAELRAIRQEIAGICQTLPEFASEVDGRGGGGCLISDLEGDNDTRQPTSKPAAAAPPVVVPPSNGKNGKATPRPEPQTKKPHRLCPKCGRVFHRNMNHVCPPPERCIDCGVAEYDHNCQADKAEEPEKTKPSSHDFFDEEEA